ncbi:hypothetical protein CIW54_15285 [Paraburkholderia sp. T12-10]|nr:hypothetical protein CIW54_15285 [Paraburkholderia sp. T12-10]
MRAGSMFYVRSDASLSVRMPDWIRLAQWPTSPSAEAVVLVRSSRSKADQNERRGALGTPLSPNRGATDQ